MSSFRDSVNLSAESVKFLEDGNRRRRKSGERSIRRSSSNASNKDNDDLHHVPEEPSPSDIGSGDRKSSGKLVSDILSNLERLIVYDDWTVNPNALDDPTLIVDSTAKKKQLPRLDELSRTVITSYSLQAYIKLLSRHHGQNIATYLHKTTNDVMTKFFRFPNGVALFHDEFYAGFGYALKFARKSVRAREKLQRGHHNHRTNEDGIVYMSPGLPYSDLPQYLTNELGANQIHSIPVMQTAYVNVDSRLDVSAFEKQLENDVTALKKTPLLVIAVVGSFVFGHNDLVSKLLELRDRFHFHLHLVGLNVAALAISEPQEYLLRVIQSTDSFTVPLGTWLGVQGLPYITMHKSAPIDSNTNAQQNGNGFSFRENLESLPWWITVQDLSIEQMKKRLDDAYNLSKTMLKYLAKFAQIEILGLGSVADVLNRIEKKTLTPPAVLTFKYVPILDNQKIGKVHQEAIDDDYTDCLNLWLGQGLMHECPYLGLQLVDLGLSKLGMAIRYCPLETAAGHKCTIDKLMQFSTHMESMLSILDITVLSKMKLPEYLADKPELKAVKISSWAGVTGLIYLPEMIRDKLKKWNEKQKEQVSHLNIELVHALRSSDSAFSLGESEDGVKCVKFGMLADERDLLELINLVASKGREIEESSQYMESLAEIVKQGIEAANEDLKRENENRLINEGVLRQVPLFGSVLNWWAPLPKQQSSMRGRAFDLITGRILSTDTVYKHKSMSGSGDYETTTTTDEYTPDENTAEREGPFDEEYYDEDVPESEAYSETDYIQEKSATA